MGAIETPNLHAVIMAGGKGTRFWPASRAHRPKQILSVAGPDPMIRATVDRILPLAPPERVLVVTGAEHADVLRDLLPDLPPENILVEPLGRNTAPCIGLAALAVHKANPGGVMLVLPADHAIGKADEFRRLARIGADLAARRDVLVTLGITPTRPETGYGYIEAGPPLSPPDEAARPVLRFHEKPDLSRAREYLERGGFFWNSGMFIWRAGLILDWMEKLLPELARGLNTLAAGIGRPGFKDDIARIYPDLPSVSIDYGVMEQADNVVVLPADIEWNDVGSWTSAAEHWPQVHGNAIKGEILALDSQGCIVYGPEKLVALLGVEDLVVVDTRDALLICPKERAQDVRLIVRELEERGRKDLL